MLSLRALVIVLLPLLAAGCYTSEKALIPPGQPAFPYQTIVYSQANQAKNQTLTLKGDQYTAVDDQGTLTEIRFKPVSGGFHLAQLHFSMGTDQVYLYGLLKVDIAAKTASAWGLVASKTDVGPGLPACPTADDTICLTDLDAYTKHAVALAASNKPDAIYTLVSLK